MVRNNPRFMQMSYTGIPLFRGKKRNIPENRILPRSDSYDTSFFAPKLNMFRRVK